MELLVLPVLLLMSMSVGWVFDTEESDAPDDDTPDTENGKQNVLRLTNDDDVASGTDGQDAIFAKDGNDQVAGGPGDDRLFLGDGADQNFLTENGEAVLDDEVVAGNDLIRGGAGDDLIVDFAGANTLYGDLGDDVIDGIDQSGRATEADSLFGGYGRDFLAGDEGDILSGGADEDVFFVSLGSGGGPVPVITDYAEGEQIFISIPLAFQDSGPSMDVRNGGIDVTLGDDDLLRIEGVTDPAKVSLSFNPSDIADQTVTPGTLALGTDGDDTIDTSAGDDAVFAGRGTDAISTGAGDDYITLRGAQPFEVEGDLGWGSNTVDAGAGDDRVLGGMSDDTVDGGDGRDLLTGGGGSDVLSGGAGADRIDGLDSEDGSPDSLYGGDGADTILADSGDQVTSGGGADTIILRDGGDPVTITDFVPGTDTLELDAPRSDVMLTRSDTGTMVSINGTEVAILEGVRPAQIGRNDIVPLT